MNKNMLMHYGIKGMKWGVRRTEAQLARARGTKATSSAGKNTTTKAKTSGEQKKKISEMTEDELKTKISRLQLEKTYRDLMKSNYPPQKTMADRGREIATDILTNSAKNIGTQTVTYVMGQGMNKLLKNIFNDPQVVNPKKGQKDK